MGAGGGIGGYAGRRVGILGLARSGLAVASALRAAGAEAVAFDDRPEARAAAAALGCAVGSGPADVAGLDALVRSPGVPASHPVAAAAAARGLPVRGDVDLWAATHPDTPVVGVTGTNGKSTTAALVHHLLTVAGRPALLGGNIGRAVFDLPEPAPGATAVLELSSYQLELGPPRCRVAVWLNLTPDHLDRHGSLEAYAAAKRRIVEAQGPGDAAVVGVDGEAGRRLAGELEAMGRRTVVRVAVGRTVEGGVGAVDGTLFDAIDGRPQPAAGLKGARGLRGAHNHGNAAAAYAALRCLGLPPAAAALGLGNFRGLPHRLEEAGRVGRVLFVDDSKATNPEAAATALGAFEAIHWVAGGLPKPGGFGAVLPRLGRVRGAYLIGAAEGELAAALDGRVPALRRCGTLEAALRAALADAEAGPDAEPVVLLAPACASFDQFASYEHRGRRFKALVRELGGGGTPPLFGNGTP